MARLYYNGDAFWLEYLRKGESYLFCKSFLYLESTGEHLGNSGELGESDHSVVGDVANVYLLDSKLVSTNIG